MASKVKSKTNHKSNNKTHNKQNKTIKQILNLSIKIDKGKFPGILVEEKCVHLTNLIIKVKEHKKLSKIISICIGNLHEIDELILMLDKINVTVVSISLMAITR